jgi:hypothetical protein
MSNQRRRTSVAEDGPREKPVPEEKIRNRAHELYQWRGEEPGRDLDDWLQAERELKEREE